MVFNTTIPNDPREQLFSFIINGKNKTYLKESIMSFTGQRCVGPCSAPVEVPDEVEEPDVVKLWSDPKSWPSGKVPVADEDVEI